MDDLLEMSPKEESILIMQGLGFVLIKLNGKIPVKKNWQDTKTSDIESDHEGNYGVVLKKTDLVIDIDPKNGGVESCKKLLADLNINKVDDFNTMTVMTGNKGLHIYLSKPEDLDVRWTLKDYLGVEFRTYGQQMAGPYSVHPKTKKPYVFRNDTRDIAPAPQNLLDLIKKEVEVKQTGLVEADISVDTITRYVKYLQDEAPAVEGKNGDNTTFLVACKGKDFGLDEASVYQLMLAWWNDKCQPPWSATELDTKVKNAFAYGIKPIGELNPKAQFIPVELGETPADGNLSITWDTKANKELKPTLNNTVNYFILPNIGLRGLLRFNTLSGEIEFVRPAPWHISSGTTRRTWGDSDAINARFLLSRHHKFDVSVNLIHEAATVAAYAQKYNPLVDYLDALVWDGQKRLDSWLTTYASAEAGRYTSIVGRKILLAAVARAYKPGIKFDHVLILEGDQGIGKSTLCQILGGKWYADVNIDPTNKDAVAVISGKWIVELSEMHVTRKSEADTLKAFISRCEDRVRPAYGRTTEDFPRTCIFLGTINPEENMGYLKDQTGNRRFWPVHIKQLRLKELREDVHQLFAEARDAFMHGEELYIIDPDTNRLALFEANKRKIKDPWAMQVTQYVRNFKDIEGNRPKYIFTEHIWTDSIGGSLERFGNMEKSRISGILRDLGYKGKQVLHEGEQHYGYYLGTDPEDQIDNDSIKE